jgi:hypothetical protein
VLPQGLGFNWTPHERGSVREEEREECLIEKDSPRSPTRELDGDLSARCQRRWFCIHRRSGRVSGSLAAQKQLVRDLLRVKDMIILEIWKT